MIGDDFLTVQWFTQVTVTAIGVVAMLTLLMVVWFIGKSPSGVQPIGNVKPYSPRPIPPTRITDPFPPRPVLTECSFCDTPIIPGATDTTCRNCGAPIRPIAAEAKQSKKPFTNCLEWEELSGDSGIITRVCTKYGPSQLPPPGPSASIYGNIPGAYEPFLPLGEAVARKLSEAIVGALYDPSPPPMTDDELSLRRNPDALDHRLIGTVRR